MGCFSFEEQYAIFDMTLVDNQFILEYLPAARGDDVRVYLYGLMQCCHPQEDMSIEQMARELRMSEEDVLAAYRRWERKGLVQRVSDRPPAYRYVSVKRLLLTGAEIQPDPEYEAFAESLYALFGSDRRLHGKDVGLCYEWVEELHLPAEVVLKLIEHMIAVHGKRFSMQSAQKLATVLAEEKCRSVEDAEHLLSRDRVVWDGARKVLRRMGKRRSPSEDEESLYRKWLVEWGFQQEAILSACAEMTTGDPSFKYLDGILRRHHDEYRAASTTGSQMAGRMQQEKEAVAPLKALLKVLGLSTRLISEGAKALYREEMQSLYPDAIILLAGQTCARHQKTRLDDVVATLRNWKNRGLETTADITLYMQQVDEQNTFLQELYTLWQSEARPNAADRNLLHKWLTEWRLPQTFIVACAAYAREAEKPMPYLDRMLGDFHRQGIVTPEAAAAAREAWQNRQKTAPVRPVKVVREQQYTQRAYTHNEEALDRLMNQPPKEDDHA